MARPGHGNRVRPAVQALSGPRPDRSAGSRIAAPLRARARSAIDIKSTIAAYETPVGDLLWHATAPGPTPTEVVGTLLDSPTSENARARGTSTR